jgi:hypothetical protein
MSDFGSEMGAADCVPVTSVAEIVSLRGPLTCTDFRQQASCPLMRAVRIEWVRGINPLSPTKFQQLNTGFAARQLIVAALALGLARCSGLNAPRQRLDVDRGRRHIPRLGLLAGGQIQAVVTGPGWAPSPREPRRARRSCLVHRQRFAG